MVCSLLKAYQSPGLHSVLQPDRREDFLGAPLPLAKHALRGRMDQQEQMHNQQHSASERFMAQCHTEQRLSRALELSDPSA